MELRMPIYMGLAIAIDMLIGAPVVGEMFCVWSCVIIISFVVRSTILSGIGGTTDLFCFFGQDTKDLRSVKMFFANRIFQTHSGWRIFGQRKLGWPDQ
jgi:hypothetical protein